MKMKKIIMVFLIVATIVSVITVVASAASPYQSDSNLPYFHYYLDDDPNGTAEFDFGDITGNIYFKFESGAPFNTDSVSGTCYSLDDECIGSELYVLVDVYNWMSGEHEHYDNVTATKNGATYVPARVDISCCPFDGVTGTYHEGTLIGSDGSRYIMTVEGRE